MLPEIVRGLSCSARGKYIEKRAVSTAREHRLILPYFTYSKCFFVILNAVKESECKTNMCHSDSFTAFRMTKNYFLSQIRLIPHLNKTQIHRVEGGLPFLGFQVTPQYRTVKKDTAKRYFRFLGKKIVLRKQGTLQPQDLENGLNAWLGHIRFGENERFEKRVFSYLRKQGVNVFRSLKNTWLVLERSYFWRCNNPKSAFNSGSFKPVSCINSSISISIFEWQ